MKRVIYNKFISRGDISWRNLPVRSFIIDISGFWVEFSYCGLIFLIIFSTVTIGEHLNYAVSLSQVIYQLCFTDIHHHINATEYSISSSSKEFLIEVTGHQCSDHLVKNLERFMNLHVILAQGTC